LIAAARWRSQGRSRRRRGSSPARRQRRDRQANWRSAKQRQRVGIAIALTPASSTNTEQSTRTKRAKLLAGDHRLTARDFEAQQAELGRSQLATAQRDATASVGQPSSKANDTAADGPYLGSRITT
jgi:hypothetical protein